MTLPWRFICLMTAIQLFTMQLGLLCTSSAPSYQPSTGKTTSEVHPGLLANNNEMTRPRSHAPTFLEGRAIPP
ncbi:hypothetical protein BJV78DRAFT_1197259 [Lactifluus subvellereus]|nr:hypothetical protein BJV78DRAFT_1197259 [Lactifluus subvellereus]